jgi:histidinol-phosphate aminotransferase
MAAMPAFRCVAKVWPSAANFFLVRVADSEAVMRAARESGILLRDFGKSLPGCIRITVGERSENDRLLALFTAIDGGTS